MSRMRCPYGSGIAGRPTLAFTASRPCLYTLFVDNCVCKATPSMPSH